MHRGAFDNPSARLVRMMLAADEVAARRIICDPQRTGGPGRAAQEVHCRVPELEADGDRTGDAGAKLDSRDEFGRRRR